MNAGGGGYTPRTFNHGKTLSDGNPADSHSQNVREIF